MSDPGMAIHWNYYEVGEGKNLSDLLGSLFKTAYIRGVATSDTSGTAHSIQEIIALARPHLSTTTEKFDFLEMQEVQPLDRPDQSTEQGVVIGAISKIHHITRTSCGKLIAREVSCKPCLQLKVIGVWSPRCT